MDAFIFKLISGIIDGLTIGSVYALSALGLSLVFGVTRVFNFCHGSFFTWGAYFAWLIINFTENRIPYLMVYVLIIPIMYLFGYVFEKITIAPLRNTNNWLVTAIIVTLASALILENLALIIFGPLNKALPVLIEGNLRLGRFAIKANDLIVFLISIIIIALISTFLGKTKIGMAMRAVAQDSVGANMVGIYSGKIFGYSLGISAALAAIAGILMTPKYYISPMGGWTIYTKSFVIVFFGGLGSFKGTLFAAFILGIVEAMVVLVLGSTWVMPVWFILVVGIMIFRPKGLFGVWE